MDKDKTPATLSVHDLVTKILNTDVEVAIPSIPNPSMFDGIDFTAGKIAWWFLKSEFEPPERRLVHPELHEGLLEEGHENEQASIQKEYDELDKIRSYDSDDEDQPSARGRMISRSKEGMIECHGANLVVSRLRKPGAATQLMKVFETDEGTNYDKDCFSGTCMICFEHVAGKADFEAHLLSEAHKDKFLRLSLDIAEAQYKEVVGEILPKHNFKARLKIFSGLEDEIDIDILPLMKTSKPELTPLEIKKLKESISIENYNILKDHEQSDAQLSLRYSQKWTKALDKKWKKFKEQEQKLLDDYKASQLNFIQNPSLHPDHDKEWPRFWEKRCQELKRQGKRPEDCDFKTEWREFWIRRMLEIHKAETEKKISTLKTSMGLDTANLKAIMNSDIIQGSPARRMPGAGSRSRPYVRRNQSRMSAYNSPQPYYDNNQYHRSARPQYSNTLRAPEQIEYRNEYSHNSRYTNSVVVYTPEVTVHIYEPNQGSRRAHFNFYNGQYF